jgi:hypothetical protein
MILISKFSPVEVSDGVGIILLKINISFGKDAHFP